MSYELQPDHIKRRVEFLLQEALQMSPRDQVITYVMRVLSNHASVGCDGSSNLIKEKNRNVSQAAYAALGAVDSFDQWSKITINEHRLPLKCTWEWLLNSRQSLSSHDVWEHFELNPMVTILKSEDDYLSSLGLRTSVGADRYHLSKVLVMRLQTSPAEIWKELRVKVE